MHSPALFLVPLFLSLISVSLAVQVFIPANIPAQCVAACNNFKRVVSSCSAATAECLCTLEVEHAGFSCSRCVATKATYPEQQRELNEFIEDCKLAGHPLPPMAFPAPGQLGTVAPTTARPSITSNANPSITTPSPSNTVMGVATPGRTLTIPATTRSRVSSRSTTSRALPTASQVIYHNSAASPRRRLCLVSMILGPALAATLIAL